YSSPSVGLVYGNYIEQKGEDGEVFIQTGTDNYDFSESSRLGPVRAIKREVFDTVGNYDTSLKYAFDYELRMRIFEKYDIAALDDVIYKVLHSGDDANNHDPALPRESY